MKKSLLVAAVALGALFAGTSAMAEGKLSYNLAVTNDYVFRGVSQVGNGNAAIQGGVDYKNGTFYAGAWMSNVDFGTAADANIESDFYFGVTPTVGNWTFDFGAIAYVYPDSNVDTTWEIKTAASHPMGKGTIGVASYWGSDTLESPYYEVNASYPIADKWTVSGALGNNVLGGYTTWNAGVTYALTDLFTLDVRYSETGRSHTSKPATKFPNATYVTLKAAF